MLVLVCPFTKSFDDIGFTYTVPDELKKYIKPGIVVDIPLQNQIFSGVVLDIQDKIDFDISKLKDIVGIKYEKTLLFSYQIYTLRWISKYYFCKIHSVINLFFPRVLRDKIDKIKLDLNSKKTLIYGYNTKKELTSSQKNTFTEIINSKTDIILYGVTGSGKTEIYINLVKYYIEKGKQTLLLVPEIILNNQIFDRFKEIFGEDVIMINSSITETQKYKNRIDIYNNNAKIIIGTRSSLFYPYKDLGLIIVDEEHDMSYKSDSTPKIDLREIVDFIGKQLELKIIYASGTPSIKTIYKGLNKSLKLINLIEEYKN